MSVQTSIIQVGRVVRVTVETIYPEGQILEFHGGTCTVELQRDFLDVRDYHTRNTINAIYTGQTIIITIRQEPQDGDTGDIVGVQTQSDAPMLNVRQEWNDDLIEPYEDEESEPQTSILEDIERASQTRVIRLPNIPEEE